MSTMYIYVISAMLICLRGILAVHFLDLTRSLVSVRFLLFGGNWAEPGPNLASNKMGAYLFRLRSFSHGPTGILLDPFWPVDMLQRTTAET